MKSLMERWGELTETHEREIAKLRADLVSARKWAKAWKGKNGYDRMMHEIYKKVRDELAEDLSEARNEIERLNGRRCDICKHGTPYYGPDQMKVKSAIWCTVNSGMDERVSKRFEFGEHYCKSWEKR